MSENEKCMGTFKMARIGCIKILMVSCQKNNFSFCEHNFLFIFKKKDLGHFYIILLYNILEKKLPCGNFDFSMNDNDSLPGTLS